MVLLRPLLALLGLGLGLALSGPAAALSKAPAGRPNIVILLADDLGWRDVGYNGAETRTPAIDALSRQGIRMDQFYVMSFCTPTRAGLLTGRWPIRYGLMHRVVWPWSPDGLPPEEVTLAEVLADAGYGARGMVGKWHLGHADRIYHPLNQGFTSFVGTYNGAIDYYTRKIANERDWHRDYEPAPGDDYVTFAIRDEAVGFLDAQRPDDPFLLYVAFTAPHRPNQAPADYLAAYEDLGNPLRASHNAMVTALDESIAAILAKLDEKGLAENTIVLFLSDNGGDLIFGASNWPLRGTKGTPYEGGVHVPAVIRWPAGGLVGGRSVREPVFYLDMLPTLARYAGADVSGLDLDGQDVSAALAGMATLADDREYVSFRGSDDREFFGLRHGRWKLVRIGETVAHGEDPTATLQLFDLWLDPGESTNVAEAHPEIVAAMMDRLRAFRALETTGKTADSYDGAAPETRQWHQVFREGKEVDDLNSPIPGFTPPKDWRIPD
ncbi:MAG: arylsulfatase [Alphaproteobacteria bacterium]|nr:arylsulfatase [Alphaproteobacteria bacterium]